MTVQNSQPSNDIVEMFVAAFDAADQAFSDLQQRMFADKPEATESGFGPEVDFAVG
jgi:hypothetical protein